MSFFCRRMEESIYMVALESQQKADENQKQLINLIELKFKELQISSNPNSNNIEEETKKDDAYYNKKIRSVRCFKIGRKFYLFLLFCFEIVNLNFQ